MAAPGVAMLAPGVARAPTPFDSDSDDDVQIVSVRPAPPRRPLGDPAQAPNVGGPHGSASHGNPHGAAFPAARKQANRGPHSAPSQQFLGNAGYYVELSDDDDLPPPPKRAKVAQASPVARAPPDPTALRGDLRDGAARFDIVVDLDDIPSSPMRRNEGTVTLAEHLEREALDSVTAMFPDCSVSYILERLRHHSLTLETWDARVQAVVDDIFAAGAGYPRRAADVGTAAAAAPAYGEDVLRYKGKENRKDYGRVEEVKVTVGPQYESESLALLEHDFPRLQPDTTILNAFRARNSQFAPTHAYLSDLMAMVECNSLPQGMSIALRDHPTDRKGKGKPAVPPAATDPRLLAEIAWLEDRAHDRASGSDGEDGGPELECGCCFAAYPARETARCEAGHAFCLDCARRHAEELIGARKPTIACMSTDEGGCAEVFPRREMRRFLGPKTMEGWEKMMQQEEIRKAGIEGLVDCPFCYFAIILEDDLGEAVTLFHCLNPACSVVSCRLCRKPNHLPKRCGEEERDRALNVQHTVEEAMTEALVRSCPNCPGSRFFKVDGCNKMTCPTCRATICYVCRQVIPGYQHFSHGADGKPNPDSKNRCPLWDDTVRGDALAVNEAAQRALEEAKKLDPAVGEEIKVDLAAVPAANARSAMQYRDQPAAAGPAAAAANGLHAIPVHQLLAIARGAPPAGALLRGESAQLLTARNQLAHAERMHRQYEFQITQAERKAAQLKADLEAAERSANGRRISTLKGNITRQNNAAARARLMLPGAAARVEQLRAEYAAAQAREPEVQAAAAAAHRAQVEAYLQGQGLQAQIPAQAALQRGQAQAHAQLRALAQVAQAAQRAQARAPQHQAQHAQLLAAAQAQAAQARPVMRHEHNPLFLPPPVGVPPAFVQPPIPANALRGQHDPMLPGVDF